MSLATESHEKKTMWVVLLTAATMAVEIIYGITTNSMLLLADGIHMGSHVLAIGLSWIAYVVVRRLSSGENHKIVPEKILSLSGYSSGLILLIFAFVILAEAVKRFYNPSDILYREAMLVASIGLIINLISAFILHHRNEDSDHNIRAAYLHVLADALTSVTAIAGLAAAWKWDIVWIDAAGAMLSAAVIIRWSAGLLRDSGRELLK